MDYFDPTYFDPTYFDTPSTSAGGGTTSGGSNRRLHRVVQVDLTPVAVAESEDWLTLIL